MTTELFGAGAGEQMALASMGSLAQTRLTQAEIPGIQAEGALKQQQLALQKRFMQNMQQMNQQDSTATDLPTQLNKMAQVAMNSGMVDRAANLAEQAATITARAAQVAHNQMLVRNAQVQQGKNTLDLMGQFLQGATDQASWDRGNTLFTMLTGRQSPYAGLPYNPDLVNELQAQSMTAKQHADEIRQNLNQQSLEQQRQVAQDLMRTRMDVLERAQDLREGRETRLAKAGGKIVGTPTKDEQSEVMRLLSTEYPNLPSDEIGNMTYSLASRAKAIRTANPGLDAESAMQQAVQEMKITNPPSTLDKAYSVAKTLLGEGDITSPMTLPPDRAKLIVGKYYLGKGGVGKYLGDGKFEVVPNAEDTSAMQDSGESSDDGATNSGY
jgi:hypothetical protein